MSLYTTTEKNMKKTHLLSFAMLLMLGLTSCVSTQKKDEPLTEVPFEPIFPAVEKVLVPNGHPEAYSDYIEFPAIPPKEGMAVVLKLNQRIVTPKHGGWNSYSGIEVNGREIGPRTDNLTPRLLLRGPIMHTILPKEAECSYWSVGSHTALMTFFSPADATEVDPRIIDSQYGFDFYLDIDDIASRLIIGADNRIENNAPNRIRFINCLSKTICPDNPMLVKDIQLGYVPKALLPELAGSKMREFKNKQKIKGSLKGNGSFLNITSDGGMVLQIGKQKIFFESAYSYQKEPEMDFNRMGVDSQSGENGLQISVKKGVDKSVLVQMKTPGYTVERNIKSCGHYFRIADTITNLKSEDIGLVINNEMALNGRMPQNGWRICGRTKLDSESALAASNPTLFISDDDFGVGLVAEDTISRNRLLLKNSGNLFVLGNRGMGVEAGKSVTLEWSIYPLANNADEDKLTSGYFDFINILRNDWNVNRTVLGPYLIDAKELPGLIPQFASVTPWLDYATGATFSRDEYKAIVTPKMQNLRKKYPGIKLMGLIETNLVGFDASKVPWGEELPLTYGDRSNPKTRYAQYLTPELTKKMDSVTPYKDSVLRDKDGNMMIDTVYVYQNIPYINLMPQPEVGNYRYKTFLEQIDFLMNEVKFDSIYIDQFNPTKVDGISYDKWDGISVELDKSGKITKRMYNYVLTGATARMNIVKRVIDRGGEVLTNGHPVTREEQSTGRLSFAEMENDSCDPIPFMDKKPPEMRYQSSGHLATPIILNLRPNTYQRRLGGTRDMRAMIINKGLITALRNAQLPYYYGTEMRLSGEDAGSFEVSNWMFPFTPVRLGEGVMVGKERTIVCKSGDYKISGNSKPKVGYFNDHGIPQDASIFEINGKPGEWIVSVRLNDWNEIAVMVVQE